MRMSLADVLRSLPGGNPRVSTRATKHPKFLRRCWWCMEPFLSYSREPYCSLRCIKRAEWA